MARVQKNRKRQGSSLLLARHRHPEAASKPASSLSSKAGRTLIRTHHTLQKKLAQALQAGDEAAAHLLRTEIEAKGGLEKYQQASVRALSPHPLPPSPGNQTPTELS
jgi:25S rRNA (adenine2142-N1)-methyltransferase